MNDRKKHVIKTAHQLFIEKGYQATSVQDILENSGISKGTFYNYFSSKSELVIAIFKNLQEEVQKERNELLVGHDPKNIDIFIKQLSVHMKNNRKNKLFFLFSEVFASKDSEIIQFLKRQEFIEIHWLYHRLIDIFGIEKKACLFDSTIMFINMLQQTSRFYYLDKKEENNPTPIIRFCMNRLVKIVEELSESGEQLLNPSILEQFLPDSSTNYENIKEQLKKAHLLLMTDIRNKINDETKRTQYWEMVDFVQDELMYSSSPRKYIIENVLQFLRHEKSLMSFGSIEQYCKIVLLFLQKLDGKEMKTN